MHLTIFRKKTEQIDSIEESRMKKVTDAMSQVLKRCEISVNGDVFSKELLMQAYTEFLSQTMEKRKHNVGIVIHPGSMCFNTLIITYAGISNLLFNETSAKDIVDSLEKGDVVVYGEKKRERFIFDGIIDGGKIDKSFKGKKYVQLRQDNGLTIYVSKPLWRLIEPYNGNAKRLDGRGIKKNTKKRDDFFVEVLRMSSTKIINVIDTSTVIVMPRAEADTIIKGTSIRFNKKEIKLLDLVTASYFTEEDEYSYGGNAGKNEPVLKVCAKASVARKLIFSRDGNKHIGLIVLGQEMINRGESELPELIKRKSLQYVYLCSDTENDFTDRLLEENEDIEVFACTKSFLVENTLPYIAIENRLTEELSRQIEIVKNKENIPVVLSKSGIDIEVYRQIRKKLVVFKRNQYESQIKDNFIIQTHSLLNLLITAPFSPKNLRECIKKGLVSIESVEEKMASIEQWAKEMPASLHKEANDIVSILKVFYEAFQDVTPKEQWLRDFLRNNRYKSIALVVPKAYYATVINNIRGYLPSFLKSIDIMTPGRFQNSRIYDVIIVLGDYEGKRFNAFRCNSAEQIISLLYDFEENSYNFKKNRALKEIRKWDKRSTLRIKNIKEEELQEDILGADIIDDEKEIDNYVSQIDFAIDTVKLNTFAQGGRYNMTTEIIAVATFLNETKAFFSKNYKAYVLDSEKGIAKEVSVPELNEGDAVIFTKNNSDTKDIVDSILRQMIVDKKINRKLIDSYNKSKKWQQCLIKYMERNQLTPRQVANKMIKLNVPVQETTVIRWLDEDTHTVGPREMDSLRAIGKLTGNAELAKTPEVYFEACREVRSIRRKILKEIGNAIISNLSGKRLTKENEFAVVYDKIDSLAEVLQIERIVFTKSVLPMNVANRPISV